MFLFSIWLTKKKSTNWCQGKYVEVIHLTERITSLYVGEGLNLVTGHLRHKCMYVHTSGVYFFSFQNHKDAIYF